MKKWTTFLFVSLIALLLTACNSTAQPVEDPDESENTEESAQETNVSELTLKEVYEKAMERQNDLTSVTAEISMEQVVSSEGTEVLNSKSDMNMDMIIEPISMYTKGTTYMVNSSTGEELPMNIEMYMVEDGIFMYDGTSQAWYSLPIDNFEEIAGQSASQADASKQLEMLQSFIEDFAFEQTNDQYILTLDASGEKFNDFLKEQALSTGVITEEDQAVLENIKYEDMSYEIIINKETFDTEEIKMVMNMSENSTGVEQTVLMNSTMKFSNFNGIDTIDVPQEVIDNATELEM